MESRKSALLKLTCQPSSDWSSLVKECKDYAECCGLLIRKKDDCGSDVSMLGSLMLLPSKYPASVYRRAVNVQQVYNELYHKIAYDYEFMRDTLASTVACDDFIRRLWQIYETVIKENSGNEFSLGILRSDYMYQLKGKTFSLAQIELNTMASSMAAVSTKANDTHKYLSRVLKDPSVIDPSRFPTNDSVRTIAEGLIKAWTLYNQPQSVVMFVVAEAEGNFADIRAVEYEMLSQNADVRVIFRSEKVLLDSISLSQDKRLLVDELEVAVVYFRWFFTPEHHRDERSWELRLLLERSQAIKAPSIQYHLVGSKKIQQELVRAGVLERFLSADKCARIRESFVGIYSLTQDKEAVEQALKSPDDYVLKPQREGGGNNFYGADIAKKLEEIKLEADEEAYILMEKVRPPPQYNCKLVAEANTCVCERTISELGIYGAVLGNSTDIVHNTTAGYLLRTKSLEVNEGGFYTGYSSMDTAYLLEDDEMLELLNG